VSEVQTQARTATPTALAIQGLSKTRQSGGRTFRLHLPKMTVPPGAFCAVIGPSGSGKSTLLDMLGLVLRPTKVEHFVLAARPPIHRVDVGALWATHSEASLAAVRRNTLGYVLQTGGLFDFLSVADNIRLPAELIGQSISDSDIDAMLVSFGMQGQAHKRPTALSGGERQRVAILRALAHKPKLVLADEPTAAVDQDRAKAVVKLLKDYAKYHRAAVVMVTHDVALVNGIADIWLKLVPVVTEANRVEYEVREVVPR
jgi:putative ABC transport system ATP-binding protein